MAADSESAAHRIGAAWPLESTNTSASLPLGSRGSKRISSKKRTDTISAHDMQLVGWPEPASLVDSRQSRRSFWAIWESVASVGGIVVPFLRMVHLSAREETRLARVRSDGQAGGR